MKKKNITINIDRLTDKIEVHTDNIPKVYSRSGKASSEEMKYRNSLGDVFSHVIHFPGDKKLFNSLHEKSLSENPGKGSINVQDFQKLHVNEWLRLVHMLDSLLPETELRVLYLQLLALTEKDRGKILRKGFRRMTQLSVQKQKEISEEQQKASFRPWHKNFQ